MLHVMFDTMREIFTDCDTLGESYNRGHMSHNKKYLVGEILKICKKMKGKPA